MADNNDEARANLDARVLTVLTQATEPLNGRQIRITVGEQKWISPGDLAQSVWRLERAGKVRVNKGMSVVLAG